LEGIRFFWKESGFFGRNQVLLVVLRIWHDNGMIRNELVVVYRVWLGSDVLWNQWVKVTTVANVVYKLEV
jgi:hypothetical protein